MKQSIFKKELSAHGKNGTVTAEVIATMNYKTLTIKGTHTVTHDDYEKSIPVHKVEVIIDGKVWKSRLEITSEAEVIRQSETLIKYAESHLVYLANKEPDVSFVDKMNEIFKL